MRVLFVGAFPAPGHAVFGGMVTSCRALLASTLPQRLELDLLDSTQLSNPAPGFAVRLLRAAVRFIRFIARMERHPPAAVLLFVADGASIVEKGAMARYARLRGVPAIMFPRAGSVVEACRRSKWSRIWVRFWLGAAAKLVCQGQPWRDLAVGQLGFAAGDVALIRNWTAAPDLLAIGAHHVRAPSATPALLFVGWVERDKGIIDLIEACRELAPRHQFTLTVAGSGKAAAEVAALLGRYGLTGQVQLRGWLSREELRDTLAASDIFVLPSRSEGLPNALVEAMAAGLAVLVSAVGAIPEVIIDRRSGLLVPPGDVPALARALAALLDSPQLRGNLGREAHRVAAAEFAVESAVEQLVEVVRSVVARQRQPPPLPTGRDAPLDKNRVE